MVSYPSWREKHFPTLLRIENTHFYGYFLSPNGTALGVASSNAIASYDISYASKLTPYNNTGHRIYNTSLMFYNDSKIIKRANDNLIYLKANEVYNNSIYLIRFAYIRELLYSFYRTMSSYI